MIRQPIEKKEDKGLYKGYRIEKQWAESSSGNILSYTVRYVAYDKNDGVCCCEEKLKDLKKYLDSMN